MTMKKMFFANNSFPLLLVMMLFSIAFAISSCGDDEMPTDPDPDPDPMGECEFATVIPDLNEAAGLDFECEGPEYSTFGEIDGAITIEYVDNPSISGINESDKVVKVTQTPGLETWAGIFFDLAERVDLSTLNGVKMKVYSPAAGQMVNLKMEDSADGSISSERSVATTVANEWEELTFTFSADDTDKFDRVALFFNFLGAKDPETVHYFDDIVLAEGEVIVAPTEPTVGAPLPEINAADVISIFSDSYTNVAGTDFNPNWGQATVVTQEDIAGNNTLKYEGLNYQGIALESAIDVSAMDFLHVDFWTENSTLFNGFLISSGPVETAHAFGITTGEWVSVDIPLTEFSSVVDLMDVIQMKFDGDGTVFLDNIYFHKRPDGPSGAAPVPTTPEADVLSVFSDSYTNVPDTDFNPDWGQATVVSQVQLDGNNTLVYDNLNYQGTMFASPIDVSGMTTLHVDYWTQNSTGFNGFLISPGPLETPYVFEVTTGEWVSVDIPLTEFSSVVNLMEVFQMKFDGNGTIYLDNIYFHK